MLRNDPPDHPTLLRMPRWLGWTEERILPLPANAYRRDHFNASDAPAMLGCSPYKRRDALLREMATGIGEEVDESTQRRFDAGHRFEANARKLAEDLLGEDLFPVVGSQGRYSASLDGLTMLGEICWEHKTLNRELREVFADIETIAPEHREHSGGKSLPLHYQVQMEQQLMVSGASKCLFTASRWADDGTLLEASHCWYHSDPELRTRIVAGWEQFESELAAYAPDEAKAAPVVGRTPENLPALLIQVSGAVTASNLGEFKEHALAVLGSINRELKTDQDFATAESTVKWCADVESRLAAAKEHALSQTATIEEVFRAIDDISAEARRVRLELDKLVKARKEEIRGEIVAGGVSAFREHIAALNVRLGRPYMPPVPADFASAIKGKRTVDSLRGAVNDELARAKIAANEIADRIQLNLTTLRELASEHVFLFADTATIVLKAPDDLTVLVKARIAEHAAKETTHDCGELGGLAQSRKRFLLVGRHIEKVPPFLYEPHSRPLRAVGDVLGRMLMPGDVRGGPMHRIPALQWKTWVRLAFVEAGSDWRSLNRLAVEDGKLRDYLIVPENRNSGFLGVGRWDSPRGTVTGRSLPNNGDFAIADPRQQLYAAGYGVTPWNAASGAVAGESLPSNGKFAVQDPRFAQSAKWKDGQALGVRTWGETSGAIAGQQSPGQGAYSVADPRHTGPAKHSNEFRIVRWEKSSMAVTSAHGTGQAVADPRGGPDPDLLHGKYPITGWDETARTVIGGNANGAFAVADPRSGIQRGKGDNYLTAGHYGVIPWAGPSGAVSAAAGHDNGRWSVADPRMPEANDKLVCRITAEDGTWHRPFTTLELAALQSLVDPEEMLELDGLSDQAWRERIGNAVPSSAAEAIAHVMGETLLLAWSGETFLLSAQPIWVRPMALGVVMGTAA